MYYKSEDGRFSGHVLLSNSPEEDYTKIYLGTTTHVSPLSSSYRSAALDVPVDKLEEIVRELQERIACIRGGFLDPAHAKKRGWKYVGYTTICPECERPTFSSDEDEDSDFCSCGWSGWPDIEYAYVNKHGEYFYHLKTGDWVES